MRTIRTILVEKKQKILITGDRGFVARHLIDELTHRDNFKSIVGLDIVDGDDVWKCYLPTDVDKVYHLAAITDSQSTDARKIYETNVLGAIRVFDQYGTKVVFASSSMVNYPQSSPYADSKFVAEASAIRHGCAVVRFCNLFGPGGHSVIDKFRDGDRIIIRGSGEQVRTYAHVRHAVRAMVEAKPGTLKILEGIDWTVNQVADMYRHGKPSLRAPASPLDLLDGRQVFPSES